MYARKYPHKRFLGFFRWISLLSIITVLILSFFFTYGSALARSEQDISAAESTKTVVAKTVVAKTVDPSQGGTLVEPIVQVEPDIQSEQSEIRNDDTAQGSKSLGPTDCIGGGLLLLASELEESSAITSTRMISGTIWLDEDEDGLQPGVPITATIGITVTCDCYYKGNGEQRGTITTTVKPDGTFNFDDEELGDFEYELSIDVPDGFGLTYQDVVSNTKDTIDSDFDPVTKKTDRFTLTVGTVVDMDAGLIDGDSDPDKDNLATSEEDGDGDGDPSNDDSDADGVPDYLDPQSAIYFPIIIRQPIPIYAHLE